VAGCVPYFCNGTDMYLDKVISDQLFGVVSVMYSWNFLIIYMLILFDQFLVSLFSCLFCVYS
jgi:hypothetical protein